MMGSKSTISNKTYFGLVLLLAVLSAISIYLPQSNPIQLKQLPASKPIIALVNALIMLFIYGGLGYLGITLSRKIDFPDLWEPTIDNYQRFVIPALVGVGIGIVLILIDLLFSSFNSFGRFPHPDFPMSLVASLTAGIGEEILFRLFFISFWVWFISYKLLKKKYQDLVFWIVALLSAILFSVSHFPSVMFLLGIDTIAKMPSSIITELLLMNGIVALFAAYYFRKYGFLAAVGIHFWVDIIWHVLWGLV